MGDGTVESTVSAVSKGLEKATNIRWVLMFLLWVLCVIAWLDRVNLSVCGPAIMQQYGFTKVQLGMCMSAFFLSYVLMQIPGGMLSEKYGIRKIGAIAIVFWSIFTILTPLAWGFVSFLVIRFIFGIGEGPLYPMGGTFIARWISSKEKAIVSGLFVSGAFFGPIIGPPMTVWILGNWGWQAVFYAYGIFGVIIGAIWYLVARDFPHEHPKANQAEVEFINEKSLAEVHATAKKQMAPWKIFLRNKQFWAAAFSMYTTSYIMYLFLSWLPIYLLEARGLSMKAMGFAAAYPWIAVCITLVGSGKISDWMMHRGYSKFAGRSVPSILGLAGGGICFYMAANAVSVNENVFWLTLCLGSLGLSYTGIYTAAHDLGQQYGGACVSWLGFWSNLGGLTTPTITAMLVQQFGWQYAFTATSFVVIFGIICWLFVKPDKALVPTT